MPRLELECVSRSFGEDPPIIALHDVDLTIEPGEFIAIEGPSGSGKSTLLNQLALLDLPTTGRYVLGETSTTPLTERTRARLRSDTFGFIFQSFHLMARRTALENVGVGLLYRGVPAAQRATLAGRALDDVGLADRADVEARKLSGGERQRVAIARATLGSAPVLVADEPTGNLDSENSELIVSQLAELNRRGSTVVMVTHDPEVARCARRRVRMRDGAVVSDETAEVLPGSSDLAPQRPGHPSVLRLVDLAREAWHAIGARPGRTASLVAAIGIAVALVVLTAGLAQTSSAQVSASFDAVRNRQVTLKVPTDSTGRVNLSVVPLDFAARIGQVRGIDSVGVLETHEQVEVATPGQSPVASVNVVGISTGLPGAAAAKVAWAPGHTDILGRNEVLVGTVVADALQIGPLALDPVVDVGGTVYAVAGVVLASDRAPQLADAIAVDWLGATEVSALDSSSVLITTVSGAAPQVASQAPLALDPITADTIEVQAPPDPTALRDSVQTDVRSALLAVTAVAALASILGVANAMLLGILERLGEFGLRRAMGARTVHVLAQTSVEALIVGLVGGLVGLCLGIGGVLAITVANRWQPVLDPRLVLLAIVGGATVGALGGVPACLRASRIQPADALRQ